MTTAFGLFVLLVVGLNLLALPFLTMLLLTSLAAVFSPRRTKTPTEPKSRFLIVVPAHDERVGIAETVKSCRALDYPSDRFGVLVIADNCSDDTAEIAARAGAEVVERHHETKRSKGYALEYLIERLRETGRLDELDAIVIIDADTLVTPDVLRKFDAMVQRGDDWIQAYYTVANADASWRTRLMTYAFSLINGVAPLGHYRLGFSSPLHGNGMCFTVRGLDRVPWRSYGLVEDYEYSWVVRMAGERIAFLPDAAVKATMLEGGGEAAAHQRRRWEFGRKEVKRRLFGQVLRNSKLSFAEKFVSAVELKTPPMMTLLGLLLGLAILNAAAICGFADPFSRVVPLALLGSSVLMMAAVGGYAISPFLVFGLPARYLLTLAYIPIYALWKISARLGGKPTRWVRTARTES